MEDFKAGEIVRVKTEPELNMTIIEVDEKGCRCLFRPPYKSEFQEKWFSKVVLVRV